jgi:hypothetical protein
VTLVLAAYKDAPCSTIAQSIGQREAAHNVSRAYLQRGIGAKNNIHATLFDTNKSILINAALL